MFVMRHRDTVKSIIKLIDLLVCTSGKRKLDTNGYIDERSLADNLASSVGIKQAETSSSGVIVRGAIKNFRVTDTQDWSGGAGDEKSIPAQKKFNENTLEEFFKYGVMGKNDMNNWSVSYGIKNGQLPLQIDKIEIDKNKDAKTKKMSLKSYEKS
jgi:hypothetical protein